MGNNDNFKGKDYIGKQWILRKLGQLGLYRKHGISKCVENIFDIWKVWKIWK